MMLPRLPKAIQKQYKNNTKEIQKQYMKIINLALDRKLRLSTTRFLDIDALIKKLNITNLYKLKLIIK